ncbi:MAG: peptide chain release factor 2 [Candidatus Staskawiczbacteria bacterium]
MSEKISKIDDLKNRLHQLVERLDVEAKKEKLKKLESESLKPNFWKDNESATKVQQEISEIKEEIEAVEKIEKNLDEKEIEKLEFKTFLSGKYDKNNAILEIFSGAGGQDSQDWATMLLRMYERYCATKEWKINILHQQFGDSGGPEGRIGTKSVTMEIKGNYAYGFLKKESGVHRLVRQSPFNAQKLRQTSFAMVNILPEIENNSELEIKSDDLKIDTFKSSGPGGQYVNKTESAVRITHLPTGIIATSQSERLQGKNKENAMKILYAKLYQLKEESRAKELKKIKGEIKSAEFGSQIRNYVLHPYKMVKDLRTQYETSDTEGVLNGDLEKFIEAELKSND